jgi:hypothetical protein
MKRLISTAKKSSKAIQEPKIEIDYNDYVEKWYKDNRLEIPERLNLEVRKFLAAVDPSKPVRRNVTRMYRVKALDLLSDSEHPKRREFLTVVEDWFGKRADGTDVPPVRDHKHGVYNEHRINEQGNVVTTSNLIYYIPFSKTEVDEWLDRSYLQDKDNILFVVDTKRGSRRKEFSYEDFVKLSWDELERKIDERPGSANTTELLNIIAELQRQLKEKK